MSADVQPELLSSPAPPFRLGPAQVDLRSRLRDATSVSHRQLERRLGLLDGLTDPAAGRQRFVALLGAFLGFHACWEPAVAACLPGETAWLRPRRRQHLIAQDLAALGLDAASIAALPECPAAASLCRTPAAAWGSVYVLEGSTLGGRVIARHLAAAPWCPPAGLRYFDPYGADSGRRWKEMLDRLAALPTAAADEAVDAAQRTFGLLDDWLPGAPALPPDRPDRPAGRPAPSSAADSFDVPTSMPHSSRLP